MIGLLTVQDILKINYEKLLSHERSIELIEVFLKKNEIINNQKLTRAIINTLLRYRIEKNTYQTIAQIDHEIYYVKVIQLWEEIINIGNKQYANSLLGVFNKYCNISEFSLMEEQLKKIIRLGFPDNLVANRNINTFLKKLYDYIKESQDCATTYNILYETISAMVDVKYIYDELDKVKYILKEFEYLGKREDAESIAEKIYQTPSLNFYVRNVKEFLIKS